MGFGDRGRAAGTSRPVAKKESWQQAGPHCLGSCHLSSGMPQRSLSPSSHPQVPRPAFRQSPHSEPGGRGGGLGRENPSPPSCQEKVQASHRSGERATLWPRCRTVLPVANVTESGDHLGASGWQVTLRLTTYQQASNSGSGQASSATAISAYVGLTRATLGPED